MYKYISTEQELKQVIVEDILPYISKVKQPVIALDLETYSEKKDEVPRPILKANGVTTGQIRTLQLGLDPTEPISLDGVQFIIDIKKIGYKVAADNLKIILENVTILGQNIKYDYQFLYMLMGIKLKKMIDTMLIGQVLYAGDIKNHGLVDIYSYTFSSKEKYAWFTTKTGMTFQEYKKFKVSQQSVNWEEELTTDNLRYAADDVYFIFYCLEEFKRRLDKFERTYEIGIEPGTGIRGVINLEFRLLPVYAMMEMRGIHIDIDYHVHVIALLKSEKEKAEKLASHLTRTYTVTKHIGRRPNRVEWQEEVTEPININSPIQLKPVLEGLLIKDLGYDIKLEGTGEDIIKKYINTPSLALSLSTETKETLRIILNFKKASSLLSKFGQKMIDLCTDRSYIHPSWFAIGSDELSVSSGRSSCKLPNCQQIPSRGNLFKTKDFEGYEVGDLFRTSFSADTGHKMVCADYSQIEARLAALICKDHNLVDRFNAESIDIYGAIAKAMMNLDYEPNKESKNEEEKYLRNYIGKTAGLSLLYGTHWKSLSTWMFNKTEGKVLWNEEKSKIAYNNFFKNFPHFRQEMDEFRQRVSSLPEEAGGLYAFTRRNVDGEMIPFYVAQSATGLKRPRRFVLKPDQLRYTEFQLSPKAPRREDEKGNLRSNIYNLEISSASREGFNHRIQSTAANILKYAAYLVHYEFIKAGFSWKEGIVALVHDEILCHIKEENVEKSKEIICRCMKIAGEKLAPGLVFNIKAKAANNWAQAK